MKKAGVKERDIKYMSLKNARMLVVHSDDERAYSKVLEDNDAVESYEVGVTIDIEILQNISTVDIRGAYFDIQWLSDFLITFVDGNTAVREVVKLDKLSSLPTIEKLELSRRYWNYVGVQNWKIVIVRKRNDSNG